VCLIGDQPGIEQCDVRGVLEDCLQRREAVLASGYHLETWLVPHKGHKAMKHYGMVISNNEID
jgi:hypothetical protein